MIEDVILIICCIASSIFWFYIMNVNIKRIERALVQFYLPLRNGHPNEYVKQGKIIKFIRKHTGLSDYDNIHWVYSVLHYLQVALLLGTPIVLASRFSVTFEATLKAYIIFFFIVMITFTLFADIFGCVQSTRCAKIKKTNPKYAKCEVRRWKN